MVLNFPEVRLLLTPVDKISVRIVATPPLKKAL